MKSFEELQKEMLQRDDTTALMALSAIISNAHEARDSLMSDRPLDQATAKHERRCLGFIILNAVTGATRRGYDVEHCIEEALS